MARSASAYLAETLKGMTMKPETNETSGAPALSDAIVASLEDYLPGGTAVAEDGGTLLQNQIAAALTQLEERLSNQSRTMLPTEEFRKISAARQAVQAAKLAMQLHQAGNQRSPN
jgi:hypothetical protein